MQKSIEKKIELFFDALNEAAGSDTEYREMLETIDSECEARFMALEDED